MLSWLPPLKIYMEQLSIVFFGSYGLCIYKTTFNKQYISEIMTVSFNGGENRVNIYREIHHPATSTLQPLSHNAALCPP